MKRSAAYQTTAGLCKRRAPYTSRACDACRRRKGKCDGQQPCDFCAARDQECIYNGIASDYWPAQHLSDPSTNSHRTGEATAALTLDHESVAQIVLQVKNQLDSLSRRVESQAATFATANRQNEDRRDRSYLALPRESVLDGHQRRSLEQTSVMTTQCFYGPTSPDYSLNIAQIRVRQTDSSSDVVYHTQLQLASIDSEPAVSDGTTDESEARESPTPAAVGERDITMHLMGFRALINYREALRLLASFQDIVGNFHPFVNLDRLVARTRAWYVGGPSLELQQFGSDSTARLSLEEDLITYNLVLAIALHADAEPRSSDFEGIIWNSCKETVNSRLISRTTGMQHVIIVLLKAWYEFVNDMPRAAWRTCGIAGRMLMELGFHDYQVLTRLVTSERQRTEASNLLCSIIVLDRQWSASTGLPANFDANSFDASLKTKIENPYLKAMMSFILISDKFHEPISRAAKGGKYPDDDSFEVLDFQIEQWRRKAVENYSFSNISEWETDPTKRPPPWAIILHLRAECIRSLLLRPFFFTHADTTSSQRYLRSAVELLVRVTDILYHLDATTDLYQKHHPYYQHVLASSTALSFLLAATMQQNKETILNCLSPDLKRDYCHSFDMSVALASKYASMSRLSRKLLKRLVNMREILQQLGVLDNIMEEQTPLASKKGSPYRNLPNSSVGLNEGWHNIEDAELCLPEFPFLGRGSHSTATDDTATWEQPLLSQPWPDSFLADWFLEDL